MARTALTGLLRRVHAAHAEAERTGTPADEVYERQRQSRLSRSKFLVGAAGAALLAGCASRPVGGVLKTVGAPRVVIVGGGLAGATCAYRLWRNGVPCTICEANSALGGRTWTLRRFFDEGQIVEHGGEFISSEHVALRHLARELGLPLEDLRAAQPADTEEIYYVRGERYTVSQMLHDYGHVYPAISAAARAAPFPTTYDHHTAAAYRLDHMSARQWIEAHAPGGLQSKIGWLMDLDATTENGGDATEQSALEVIYMLGYMPALTRGDQFYLVGTDERYHVIGGNDRIIGRLAQAIPAAAVRPATALVALRRRSDGLYACTLVSQLRTFELLAEHVVLALPFTTLRRVDLSRADFSPLKMTAIRRLPMGTNTKLHLQFEERMWYKLGYNGYTYADTGFQQTWEASRAQGGKAGILTDYYGGHAGAAFAAPSFGPAAPRYSRAFLKALEPLYPGITKASNGKAYMDYWTGDPWHGGSYSYLGVGMFTSFGGIEGTRQGNVHFCGEHTSVNYGGFMNGAVETGEKVALQILKDLRVPSARSTQAAS